MTGNRLSSLVQLLIEQGTNVLACRKECTELDFVFHAEAHVSDLYLAGEVLTNEDFYMLHQNLKEKIVALAKAGVSNNRPVGATEGFFVYRTLKILVVLCVYQNRTKFLSRDCLRCLYRFLL
jgi:hypothetical protein